MIKILASFVMMLVASVVFSQEASLLNYVPKDVDGFISVNIQDVLNHPKMKEFIASPKDSDKDFNEMKKAFSDSGIDIFKAFTSGVIYFRIAGDNGAAIKTSVNENLLKTILDKSEQTKGKLKSSVVKGKTVYSIENLANAGQPAGKETFFAYAAPDVIVVSDKKDEIVKMTSLQDGSRVAANAKLMDLSSKIDKVSSIWGVCEYNAPEKKNDPADMQQQMLPIDNICGGSVAVKLTGDKKECISTNLKLSCREKVKAQMLTVQLQAMVMMAIPSMSQGNAQLAEDLTKAIKFTNEENDIVINLEITPSIIEQLKKASENMGKMQPAGEDDNGMDAPAGAGNPAKPEPRAKPEAAPKAAPKAAN
ncbi:MAG TPA: hypothetical protein DET40_12560 [Lentisphaeria bacterium]|nr:MAG: hypothetical protein A2X45_22380 [Lentisphaerae bacterium GWF2_50_93]HCE44371.1 hypothetical protein [Lentisphaeria bacterium]